MSSKSKSPTPTTVAAAGAVLWRRTADSDDVELAIVHRPRYDDWSLPKGKLDLRETPVMAAIREIEEETGFASRLGRHLIRVTYPIAKRLRKQVDYWSAEVTGGSFTPNSEVDQLQWLSRSAAAERLSYSLDRKVLQRFTALTPFTTTLLLVRHARAGSRAEFTGDDTLRPLDKNGRAQAEALVGQLLGFGASAVHSTDRTRCIQTVSPLAEELGVEIILEPLLSEEGYAGDVDAGRARVKEIASLGGVRTICSQGGVIPDLLQWWSTLDGVEMPDGVTKKASTWVLSMDDGKLVTADFLESPQP